MQPDDFESRNSDLRDILRFIGPAMMVVGGIFLAVGMISFFSAFGGGEPPRLFWCAFVGIPLLGIGSGISRFAYVGAIARYMAGEVSPVGKDVINYMAEGTKESVRDVAAAVAGGLREGGISAGPSGVQPTEAAPQVKVRCQHCHALNDETAKFCNQCGTAM